MLKSRKNRETEREERELTTYTKTTTKFFNELVCE